MAQNEDTGKVRYNFETNNYEIHDGLNWMPAPSSTLDVKMPLEYELALSTMKTWGHDVPSVFNWVWQKQREEDELAKLAQSNPALADLVEELNTVKNKIKVVKNLVGSEDK
jgi:hypothetical protein